METKRNGINKPFDFHEFLEDQAEFERRFAFVFRYEGPFACNPRRQRLGPIVINNGFPTVAKPEIFRAVWSTRL